MVEKGGRISRTDAQKQGRETEGGKGGYKIMGRGKGENLNEIQRRVGEERGR